VLIGKEHLLHKTSLTTLGEVVSLYYAQNQQRDSRKMKKGDMFQIKEQEKHQKADPDEI
jgi:hypothetical protein